MPEHNGGMDTSAQLQRRQRAWWALSGVAAGLAGLGVAYLVAALMNLRLTPVSAVASQQHPGWVIEADPAGDVMPAVAALQEFQITVGAVVHQGRVVGVVHAADIGRALNG